MKTKILFLALIISFLGCSEEAVEPIDQGKPTIIKGNVSDLIRGLPLDNYNVKLVKCKTTCANWMCGLSCNEVSTVKTNSEGNYEIQFNYKLNNGESYGFQLYQNSTYINEIQSSNGINSGQTNFININAWKPINLKLNINVTNNSNNPLMVGNFINNSSNLFLNSERIYEENITKTIYLRTKPNSVIKIVFWYHTGTNPTLIRHEKKFDYQTNLDDIIELNFDIDCSTF